MSHKYLILGLLAQNPMTGYDMRKHIQAVLNAVTNASYGSLYPTLHKLLAEAYVQMDEIEQESRPDKKVYHITPKGLEDLQEWLKKPPMEDKIKHEFLLKLYFAQAMSAQEIQEMLKSRYEEIQARLLTLATERQATNTSRQNWILDYLISVYRAELKWLEQVQSQLNIA